MRLSGADYFYPMVALPFSNRNISPATLKNNHRKENLFIERLMVTLTAFNVGLLERGLPAKLRPPYRLTHREAKGLVA
jgi:hypothetical protein